MVDGSKIFSLIVVGFLLLTFALYAQDIPLFPKAETAGEEGSFFPIEEALGEELESLVDIDLKDVDIREVAEAFSRIAGINIIVAEEAKAKVSIRLKGIDWAEALDTILQIHNLSSIRKKEYIKITTPEKLEQERERVPLETKIITLNFLDVDQARGLINSLLSRRGKIMVDSRTNSLVVSDIPYVIEEAEALLAGLDTRTLQVMIETMILDVKLTDEDDIGVDWTLYSQGEISTQEQEADRVIEQSLSLTGTTSGLIKYGRIFIKPHELSTLINFWQSEKKVEILANPRILTLNNLTAEINITEQVPYVSDKVISAEGVTTYTISFKESGIKLSVTPAIKGERFISLSLDTEQSIRTGWTTDNQPIIDTRKAQTNFLVEDGETIVIGGLRKKENVVTVDKLPILGDIPLLGGLFRRSQKEKIDTELLIFVTPHLVSDARLDVVDERKLRDFKEKIEEKILGKAEIKTIRRGKPFPLRSPNVK